MHPLGHIAKNEARSEHTRSVGIYIFLPFCFRNGDTKLIFRTNGIRIQWLEILVLCMPMEALFLVVFHGSPCGIRTARQISQSVCFISLYWYAVYTSVGGILIYYRHIRVAARDI